jgi:hypothetical protein
MIVKGVSGYGVVFGGNDVVLCWPRSLFNLFHVTLNIKTKGNTTKPIWSNVFVISIVMAGTWNLFSGLCFFIPESELSCLTDHDIWIFAFDQVYIRQ